MVPPVEEVSALLVARLGWRWAGGLPVPLAGLSVKLGTVMQLDMVVAARQAAHVRFIQEALGVSDLDLPLPEGQLSSLRCVFPRLWSLLRWENEHKEAWWRLTVDGIPLLGESSYERGAACCLWLWGISWGDPKFGLSKTPSFLGVPCGSGGG